MNEPTPPSTRVEKFAVFRFCLGPGLPGLSRQAVRNLGEFTDIEQAFELAREEAEREIRLASTVCASTAGGRTAEALVLFDTEFGYDVKRDNQVVVRFWVHSRPELFA